MGASHNAHIKGNPIKPSVGRPANFHSPSNLRGTVKSGTPIRGGNNQGIERKSEYFMKSQANGKETVVEAKGKHLA